MELEPCHGSSTEWTPLSEGTTVGNMLKLVEQRTYLRRVWFFGMHPMLENRRGF